MKGCWSLWQSWNIFQGLFKKKKRFSTYYLIHLLPVCQKIFQVDHPGHTWEDESMGVILVEKGFYISPTKQALIPRYWNCMLVSNRIVLPHGSVFRRLNLTLWGEGTPLAFRVLTRSYLTNVICHFPNPCEFPNCI